MWSATGSQWRKSGVVWKNLGGLKTSQGRRDADMDKCKYGQKTQFKVFNEYMPNQSVKANRQISYRAHAKKQIQFQKYKTGTNPYAQFNGQQLTGQR